MAKSQRALLLALAAILAGLVAVQAAPSGHLAKRAVRKRRSSPLELPRKFQTELPVSFGREDIPIPAEEDPPVAPVNPLYRRLIFSQTIDLGKVEPNRKNVVWSRLVFDPERTRVRRWRTITTNPWGDNLPGDVLRITSLQDGSVQYLNNQTIREWNFRSAYFNGGRIRLEFLIDRRLPGPRNTTASVVVQSVLVNGEQGRGQDAITLPPPNSLCNAADERRPINDPRSGRIFPIGCTGWTALPNGCQLTAGHCFEGVDPTELVLQANVPQSAVVTINNQRVGIPRHPPASSQWAIDPKSVQWALVDPMSVPELKDAQDWATFGAFRNPNTGLTFKEAANNQTYTLAQVDSATGQLVAGQAAKGQAVTITGFGVVRDQARKNLHLAQQTHSGAIFDFPSPNHVDHRVDTEPGNSGSPIAIGDVAIGIHTNGGCDTNTVESANWGSTINMPGLQEALKNQRGVCATVV
ncbi:hypothetical protein BCR44DRAFT_1280831 [Catenaria anguillulae PL171]|uniref:Serine protease n=1 Tax=Catenaria anguillulae PL171 TaxID=765915 RepID=A0A1Y2HVU8_9FUNG|nr:hypothetical protein BCR44DRAFT_1280831 [Catenaria anguillulae PL171]